MLVSIGRGISPLSKFNFNSLKDLLPSAVFDVDATKSASYAGSGQVWANLVPTPADGSAQTDYDMYLGATSAATTDDPTFNGTADDMGAYFSTDGNDLFTLKSGINPAFIKSLHKTTGGSDFTIAVAYRPVDVTLTVLLVATNTSSATNGIEFNQISSEKITLTQGNGTASVISTANQIVTPATDSVIIVSYRASDGKTRIWKNSSTKTEETMTFGTTTTDPTSSLRFFRNYPAGGRVYAVSMFNTFIDDGEAATILSAYKTRHGRNYG